MGGNLFVRGERLKKGRELFWKGEVGKDLGTFRSKGTHFS